MSLLLWFRNHVFGAQVLTGSRVSFTSYRGARSFTTRLVVPPSAVTTYRGSRSFTTVTGQ